MTAVHGPRPLWPLRNRGLRAAKGAAQVVVAMLSALLRRVLPRSPLPLALVALLAMAAACGGGSAPCRGGPCVRVLAGGSASGYQDGPALKARFENPHGVAVDARGVIYVADTDNNRIRRIAPDGTVSTIAGSGRAGGQDGPPTTAQFAAPTEIAVDPGGALYVAEYNASRVRKIAPDGTVTTLLNPSQIAHPNSIVVGADGVLYIGAAGARGLAAITTIKPDGTVAPLPSATALDKARLVGSPHLALDAAGVLYVVGEVGTPTANGAGNYITGHAVVALPPSGSGTVLPIDLGIPAPFEGPGAVIDGIAVLPDGTIYLAVDCGLQVFHPSLRTGSVTRGADVGSPEHCGFANGPADSARFGFLLGATVDSAGTIYLAEGSFTSGSTKHANSAVRAVTVSR